MRGGNAADVLEDGGEALADALGRLPAEHLGDAHVGIGEGQHEEAEAPLDAPDVEVRLAEVGLGGAGRPVQVQEPLALAAALGLEHPHVLAHGGLGDVDALLLGEPDEYPVGSVALLPPGPAVLVEPGLYERAVRVEDAPAPRGHGHARRQVVLAEVLVDGVAGDPRPARYLAHPLALPEQLPYSVHSGHADHPFFLPRSDTHPPIKVADCGGRHVPVELFKSNTSFCSSTG